MRAPCAPKLVCVNASLPPYGLPLADALAERSAPISGVQGVVAQLAPGEGGFKADQVMVGLVLRDQPQHSAAYGSDRMQPIPLAAGSGWIFPQGMDGFCRWDGQQDMLNLFVDRSLLRQAGLHDAAGFAPVVGPHNPLLVQLALTLQQADADSPRLYRDTLALGLAAQVAQIVQQQRPEVQAGSRAATDARIARAIDYLQAHLADDLPLEVLAAQASMSPFHFSRAFKQATGASPHQWLIARRIERAQALLRANRMAVEQVAYAVGYKDAKRFADHFKRAVGSTPGVWRAG